MWLEAHSKAELNNAWQVVLARYLAKGCRPKTCVWWAELRMVEEIKKFRPEFKSQPVIRAELRGLEGGEIDVLDSIRAKVWFGAGIGSISVVSGSRERRGIEPLI